MYTAPKAAASRAARPAHAAKKDEGRVRDGLELRNGWHDDHPACAVFGRGHLFRASEGLRWFHASLFRRYWHATLRFCRWLRFGSERLLDDKGWQELSERTQEVSLF